MGADAHAFADGVPLVLGGVRFDHPRGLAGHSDGDVIAHALTDAILGAAGLGDIGSLFPSGDERFRGADSVELLREAHRQVREAGWTVVNGDRILNGEAPRIAARREEMRTRLSDALDGAEVNVGAPSSAWLESAGRGGRLTAQAVALLAT